MEISDVSNQDEIREQDAMRISRREEDAKMHLN
jgi:hypothetical protein